MDYILNLGINPDAVAIGSALGQPTAYYPLQMALEASGAPAWFTNFSVDDRLQIRIWNLSANTSLALSKLRMAIGNNTAAPTGEIYDPNEYFQLKDQAGERSYPLPTVNGSEGVEAMSFFDGYWQQAATGETSPWGTTDGYWRIVALGDQEDLFLTFSGSGYNGGQVKMEAGILVKTSGSEGKDFLVDPEMIVNEDPKAK